MLSRCLSNNILDISSLQVVLYWWLLLNTQERFESSHITEVPELNVLTTTSPITENIHHVSIHILHVLSINTSDSRDLGVVRDRNVDIVEPMYPCCGFILVVDQDRPGVKLKLYKFFIRKLCTILDILKIEDQPCSCRGGKKRHQRGKRKPLK